MNTNNKQIHKLAIELERLVNQEIPLSRSLDLLEASTNNIDEIIIINTFRESLLEMNVH